jgi:hypothetical protein
MPDFDPRGIGFGRLPAHGLGDDQDEAYPLRGVLPAVAVALPPYKYWSNFYKALDQGATGTCVGHAAKQWMLAGPVRQTTPTADPSAFQLYLEACKNDEWPENDYGDLMFGTSVRAMFKVLQKRGLLTEYRWAQSIADVRDFVSLKGPIVVGSWWYEGMFWPDAEGVITPTGSRAGGHAYLIIGTRVTDTGEREYRILNSWGPDWGERGRAWISEEDLDRLIFAEGGEAAAGIETRIVRRLWSRIRRIFPW